MTQGRPSNFENPETLGDRIQIARKRLGMTQAHLGRITGAGQSQVARWENGHRIPSGNAVIALAQVLQVPLRWLEKGGGPPPELEEVELEALMKARLERLQVLLGGHANLRDLAKQSGLEEISLKLAIEGKRTLTLDEASRIAHAANFSLSWLLYGEKQTPFSLDLEDLRRREIAVKDARASKERRSEQIRRFFNMDAILERRHRFVALLRDQSNMAPIAELAGVPQEVIDSYMEGRGDLTMDQIERILAANGVSFDWIMYGEEPSFLTKMAARLEGLSSAIRSYNEDGRKQGFLGLLLAHREKQRLKHMLRYVELKPLLNWVLTQDVYLPLTLDQCEAELAKRLNPKRLKLKSLDWDSLVTAQELLAYAGMDWCSEDRPSPEVLRIAYQHALEQSIAGREPKESFIDDLRRLIHEDPIMQKPPDDQPS